MAYMIKNALCSCDYDVLNLTLHREHFVYAPSQWQTLHCNIISHWLGTCTKWSLTSEWSPRLLTCLFACVSWFGDDSYCMNLIKHLCLIHLNGIQIQRILKEDWCNCVVIPVSAVGLSPYGAGTSPARVMIILVCTFVEDKSLKLV